MIEDILAPGRVLESLIRRASRGNKAAHRLLLELAPDLFEAEDRLLYPELLRVRASGLQRAWLMPLGNEHEQMLQIVEQLRQAPTASRDDPMFRALEWLVLRHSRAEREWLQDALTRKPLPDARRLARFVERTRPLVERATDFLAGSQLPLPLGRRAAARSGDLRVAAGMAYCN